MKVLMKTASFPQRIIEVTRIKLLRFTNALEMVLMNKLAFRILKTVIFHLMTF